MKAFWTQAQLAHAPRFFLQRGIVKRNFETPARAESLLEACRALNLEIVEPRPVGRVELEAVHAPDYLDFLRDGPDAWALLPEHGPEMVANTHASPEMAANGARRPTTVIGKLGWHTTDTACPITSDTWPSALGAAAGAIAAADEVAAGRSAYALARPPGHHAYAARAGGHCYLNNAALAAVRLRAKGAARVGVLDIDAHHGNGTQGIFWERDDVVFVSVHGDPSSYYPWFVGHSEGAGSGACAGCNLNLPLPQHTGDDAWLAAIAHGIERLRRCGVEALVVSLGFDASVDEPLSFLAVTADGFARAGAAIRGLGVPCVLVQEGGYNVALLGVLLARFLEGFAP
jgi:acetoin utilization deacetylase AcuC-like enzyme